MTWHLVRHGGSRQSWQVTQRHLIKVSTGLSSSRWVPAKPLQLCPGKGTKTSVAAMMNILQLNKWNIPFIKWMNRFHIMNGWNEWKWKHLKGSLFHVPGSLVRILRDSYHPPKEDTDSQATPRPTIETWSPSPSGWSRMHPGWVICSSGSSGLMGKSR